MDRNLNLKTAGAVFALLFGLPMAMAYSGGGPQGMEGWQSYSWSGNHDGPSGFWSWLDDWYHYPPKSGNETSWNWNTTNDWGNGGGQQGPEMTPTPTPWNNWNDGQGSSYGSGYDDGHHGPEMTPTPEPTLTPTPEPTM